MKYKRVMIAAPKSGSGKTTITCALLQALKDMGYQVASFKCGPDYIDPMFHEKVIKVPSRNLDTFFTDEEQTRKLFLASAPEDGISVMEGVMGIFDGLGGICEEGSSYHLAKATGTPILFVADAKGMGRSILPFLAGFLSYDKNRLIRGVILNRISKGYYEILKPLIEEELRIPVLGFFPEKEELRVESRHLGLVMPRELQGIQRKLQAAAGELMEHISIEGVLKIAEGADGALLGTYQRNLMYSGKIFSFGLSGSGETEIKKGAEDFGAAEAKNRAGAFGAAGAKKGAEAFRAAEEEKGIEERKEKSKDTGIKYTKGRPVIAVAKDEAFCFYYADNLRMLAESGAELKYFSPLHDKELPGNCHALLFGGGYPESYAKELSGNTSMLAAVRQAAKSGMPVVAECGGFMYLHSELVDKEGSRYACAGVIQARCACAGRLVRFGYIELQEKESHFLPKGGKIKGHEFHYFDSTDNGKDVLAVKPATGRTYPCIISGENYWMGFPHLYYPSNPKFAENFVAKAEKYKEEGRG